MMNFALTLEKMSYALEILTICVIFCKLDQFADDGTFQEDLGCAILFGQGAGRWR